MADVAAGGKAVFHFSITNAGDYQIESVVYAPDDSSNSFFVNIDAPPTDPDMIWDIEVTDGFEKRLVNWRGDGDSSNGQFVPKTFKLGVGGHTLILVGREPDVRLKSVTSSLPRRKSLPVLECRRSSQDGLVRFQIFLNGLDAIAGIGDADGVGPAEFVMHQQFADLPARRDAHPPCARAGRPPEVAGECGEPTFFLSWLILRLTFNQARQIAT